MSEHYIEISAIEWEDGELLDYEYDALCSGVDEDCRAWESCVPCSRLAGPFKDTITEYVDHRREGHLHGRRHRLIDGLLMVPLTGCVLHLLDGDAQDTAHTLALRYGIGRYPIDLDCDEGSVYTHPHTPTPDP